MADFIDFFGEYVMGSIQALFGYGLFVRFLQEKGRLGLHILFAVCAVAVIHFVPGGAMAEFGAYVVLLGAGGILICHADRTRAVLYALLTVESMQLSYGVEKSLLSIAYPHMRSFDQDVIGIVFMLSGELISLLLTGICCSIMNRRFSWNVLFPPDAPFAEKRYMLPALIPVLMIFVMDDYINSDVYGAVVTDEGGIAVYANHYKMLVIQLLGIASLFCVLSAYKKSLQNFRLNTELSLLEQEEHSLNQYVEEARTRYEKTKAFRHDIRNHIAVVKRLLQSGKTEQALNYIQDMDEMAEKLSFPCSTNNPVVDILAGNKLGIARSMGIRVSCSLLLPYPCGVRDIDLCIILSNALDNAIHACRNIGGDQEKYIRMDGRLQGDFLFMEIENSYQGSGMFKKGTGLSNIRTVTEKYHGAMSTRIQEQTFVLHVLLIIPQHPEETAP